jgi:hypothetical protein
VPRAAMPHFIRFQCERSSVGDSNSSAGSPR